MVPLYNEQENLEELHGRLAATLRDLGEPYEVLLVDDGSTDATPELLGRIQAEDERVGVLALSRNFGHQAAVSAGLDHARGRAVVVLDGDLQDPPELIPELVRRWREGYEVVYAVRRSRRGGWGHRLAYRLFYRLLRLSSELEIPLDSGDFGLLDRRVVAALRRMPEQSRFLRGMRSFVGFRQTALGYDRPDRAGGRPKFTLRKLLGLAVDGLVSFGGGPLRLVTAMGLVTTACSLGLVVWVLADALGRQTAPRGWASTIAVVLFMGAVQLLSLGIIGEYIRLIFVEAKRRPTYVVAEHRPAAGRGGSRPPPPRRPATGAWDRLTGRSGIDYHETSRRPRRDG